MHDNDPPKSDSKSSTTVPGVDATIGFEGTLPSSDRSSPRTATKQYRDLAVAAILLRSGKLSERHLSRALLNWTTHGGQPLGAHLVKEGFLTQEQQQEVNAQSERELKSIADDLSLHGDITYELENQFWLEQIDRSGKVSKLLGIADDSMLAPQERQYRKIGARYTLLRKLGQGGLGIVWLARDENLRRYVAVKEITHQLRDDEQASAHFRREAEITGRLEHPGIVPIYQFGTDEETGRGFYTMRFLGKRTLHDAIVEFHERRDSGKDEPMMMHRMLTAFVNVCQAVAHAHSRNVIHRDLKPENIALNSFGQVVLLDWGLAKINDDTGMYDVDGESEPGDLHNVGSTLAGRVLGTPLYMAPEQAAGRLEEVDHLTDIYGLGGILFAILTGIAPHEEAFENGDRKATAADVFSTILSQKMKSPKELIPDVPAELDAICKKALQPKRYLRYDSASSLAEEIQRYMVGEPVTAYVTPLRQRLRRWMSKHPTTSQLLLLLASLLLIGGAAIGFTARQGKRALEEARHAGLVEITKEIEANLRFDAQGLAQDVGFVTDLPLTQAVIASRDNTTRTSENSNDEASQRSGNAIPVVRPPIAGPISNVDEVSAEEWLARYASLQEGLLRANPAYLVMGSFRIKDQVMGELVRAERFSPAAPPHRVPRSQLVTITPPVEAREDMTSFRPGQVALMTGDQLSKEAPTKNRSALILVAIRPIFDERSGELFGGNVIEMDLRKRLQELLLAVAPNDVTVYITDVAGNVVLTFHDGEATVHPGTASIVVRHAKLKSLFEEDMTSEFREDARLYGRIVPLTTDLSSKATIGVVVEFDP